MTQCSYAGCSNEDALNAGLFGPYTIRKLVRLQPVAYEVHSEAVSIALPSLYTFCEGHTT